MRKAEIFATEHGLYDGHNIMHRCFCRLLISRACYGRTGGGRTRDGRPDSVVRSRLPRTTGVHSLARTGARSGDWALSGRSASLRRERLFTRITPLTGFVWIQARRHDIHSMQAANMLDNWANKRNTGSCRAQVNRIIPGPRSPHGPTPPQRSRMHEDRRRVSTHIHTSSGPLVVCTLGFAACVSASLIGSDAPRVLANGRDIERRSRAQ